MIRGAKGTIPEEQWVIGFDQDEQRFHSYNPHKGTMKP